MSYTLLACCVLVALLFAALLSQRGAFGLPVVTCLSTQYACRGGGCIPKFWQCDGDEDCMDGSDEMECPEVTCSGFLCSDGQCITMAWRCDGEEDCRDGSDEQPDICGKGNATCTSKQFQCSNMLCIPQNLVCNGRADCKDASDEITCPFPSCKLQEFQCLLSGFCLPTSTTCDGKEDCPDGSDELSKLCQPQQLPLCADSEFQCAPGQCIPNSWKCDGHADCDNEGDEAECSLSEADSTERPSVGMEGVAGNHTTHEAEDNLSRVQGKVYWTIAASVFLGLILMSCIVWWCRTKRKWSFLLLDFVEISKKYTVPKQTQSSSSSYMLTEQRTEDGED